MLFRPLGIFQFLNGLVMFLGSLKFFNELDMLLGIFQFLNGLVVSPLGRLSLGILNPLNGFNLFRLGILNPLNGFNLLKLGIFGNLAPDTLPLVPATPSLIPPKRKSLSLKFFVASLAFFIKFCRYFCPAPVFILPRSLKNFGTLDKAFLPGAFCLYQGRSLSSSFLLERLFLLRLLDLLFLFDLFPESFIPSSLSFSLLCFWDGFLPLGTKFFIIASYAS